MVVESKLTIGESSRKVGVFQPDDSQSVESPAFNYFRSFFMPDSILYDEYLTTDKGQQTYEDGERAVRALTLLRVSRAPSNPRPRSIFRNFE